MRPSRGALAALAALLATACLPARVDIAEQPSGGFVAVAHGDDAETCRKARDRAGAEARYHCSARGQRASLGKLISEDVPAGCRVELPFWCRNE